MSRYARTFFFVIVASALIFVLLVAARRGTLGPDFRAGLALGVTLVSLVVLPFFAYSHERRIAALERSAEDRSRAEEVERPRPPALQP